MQDGRRKGGDYFFITNTNSTETATPVDLDMLVYSISLQDYDTVQSGHFAILGI